MREWWKKAVFYEIYIRSFCDGNGDGIGDFIGLTQKLDYLKEMGIDCVWLTPFYRSPKIDNGYDISDYYDIDPDYGTMEDFEVFLREAHKRNIKVIVDLVLNHTSSEHPWFFESKSSVHSPKRDWYIWKKSRDGGLPNNWESFFEGPAWEYDKITDEYYYHAFSKEQVDLNWRNPEVKKTMFEMVKFWLDKGIDGFRLDVIDFLLVDKKFRDNPYDQEGKQIHKYDKDLPETLKIVEDLRKLIDTYPDKVLVGEVGTEDIKKAAPYLDEKQRLHLIFNFNLGSIPELNIDRIFNELIALEENLKKGLPTLFFSSHDMSRHVSRFGNTENREEIAKLFAMFILTAKGVPFIYQGDELGMTDIYINDIKDMRDVAGKLAYERALANKKSKDDALKIANEATRDKGRNPMQWNNKKYAGFSISKPWLSVNENYLEINVENQKNNTNSVLSFYKKLINLKKSIPALSEGDYLLLKKQDEIIYYIREKDDSSCAVFLNFSNSNKTVDIKELNTNKMHLLVSSKRNSLNIGEKKLTLLPYEALMIKLFSTSCIL